MELIVGGRAIKSAQEQDFRMAMLLWGMAGCGKTTLAATAPGKKLWILFDPSGALSLTTREDVFVLDLSAEKHIQAVEKLKADDPYGIEKALVENTDIETVVLDSTTALSNMATENAVYHVRSATLENPGLKGYGHRNAIVMRVVTQLMRITNRHKRHFICISHEDTPTTNENGEVTMISLALGAKMTNQIGMQLSEIWWMSDTGKERRIAVRPVRQRQPMKTRMFDTSSSNGAEFVWRYDALNWKGDGIETWYNAWKENGGRKINLPK